MIIIKQTFSSIRVAAVDYCIKTFNGFPVSMKIMEYNIKIGAGIAQSV
jgi:hypothetical protein